MVELSELSYYRYCRITVCYLIGRRSGHQNMVELSATDGHRLLCEAYGKHALSIKSCEYWFRRFKSGDFDTRDKERGGRPIKFEDAEFGGFIGRRFKPNSRGSLKPWE
ncbi:hypothetical protein LAZ67_3005622 [Cordylochernes scorpioides]|uniref:Mos1 transposase HTH domain-containing protein n=1 Tax=Cordylochernes scorpioides TaxID=51811 RepID=A0ABY6KAH2_9ARAC|nr:hypothetical protein LAZ67_3005622 [Cordylochernes scorpioides]